MAMLSKEMNDMTPVLSHLCYMRDDYSSLAEKDPITITMAGFQGRDLSIKHKEPVGRL